jgi:hypothetical protein
MSVMEIVHQLGQGDNSNFVQFRSREQMLVKIQPPT